MDLARASGKKASDRGCGVWQQSGSVHRATPTPPSRSPANVRDNFNVAPLSAARSVFLPRRVVAFGVVWVVELSRGGKNLVVRACGMLMKEVANPRLIQCNSYS